MPMTLPTVSYDHEQKTILASVILSSEDQLTYRHQVPPICVPGATGSIWTVMWTLVSLGDFAAEFSGTGFLPFTGKASAPLDIVVSEPTLLSRTQCAVQLTNNVQHLDSFQYNLDFVVVTPDGVRLQPAVRGRRIDPTIVVAEDPIIP